MGLDMYLEKEMYLGCYTSDAIIPFTETHNPNGNKTVQVNLQNKKVEKIVYEVLYWRKANAIHKWFVDNVQDGQDDCNRYYVPKDKLKQLLELCKQVKEKYDDKNKSLEEKEHEIEQLLPVHEGFFFGSYEYDSYYMDCINDTIETLETEINSPDFECYEYNYYYQSSW